MSKKSIQMLNRLFLNHGKMWKRNQFSIVFELVEILFLVIASAAKQSSSIPGFLFQVSPGDFQKHLKLYWYSDYMNN